MRIGLSILTADFGCLESSIRPLIADVDFLHLDVMDGHFVPNLSFGVCVISSLRRYFELPFDIHLMVTDPIEFVDKFKEVGADEITFHYESYKDTHRIIQTVKIIKSRHLKAYLAINPKTQIEEIDREIFDKIDGVLIMSVNPGAHSQTFKEEVLQKAAPLKDINTNLELRIDGGINESTGELALKANITTLIVGSYAFSQPDNLRVLRRSFIKSLTLPESTTQYNP